MSGFRWMTIRTANAMAAAPMPKKKRFSSGTNEIGSSVGVDQYLSKVVQFSQRIKGRTCFSIEVVVEPHLRQGQDSPVGKVRKQQARRAMESRGCGNLPPDTYSEARRGVQ